jgi:hypothetical protein
MTSTVDGRERAAADPLPSLTARLQFEGVERASFSPEEVTSRMGIQPSLTFRKGEPRQHQSPLNARIARHSRDVWLYRVGPEESLDIRPLLESLKRDIVTSPGEIKAICADLNLEVLVMVGVVAPEEASWPICFFPKGFLAWVAEIGASIDVDLL